jgi:hypothetical protein
MYPCTTTIVSAWSYVPPLLEEHKLMDLKFLYLFFAPTFAVTPTNARGKRYGLPSLWSSSLSFSILSLSLSLSLSIVTFILL